jgi:hypothetical protein
VILVTAAVMIAGEPALTWSVHGSGARGHRGEKSDLPRCRLVRYLSTVRAPKFSGVLHCSAHRRRLLRLNWLKRDNAIAGGRGDDPLRTFGSNRSGADVWQVLGGHECIRSCRAGLVTVPRSTFPLVGGRPVH